MEDNLHKKVEYDEAEVHKHVEYDVSHLNFNKDMVHVKIKLSLLNIQNQEHIERLKSSFQEELLKKAQEIVESYKIMCKENLATVTIVDLDETSDCEMTSEQKRSLRKI